MWKNLSYPHQYMSVLDSGCPKDCSPVGEYFCTLNQVDIKTNHNKFYICQVVSRGSEHFLWARWGRVGLAGQSKLEGPSTKQEAILLFKRTFRTKTGNGWGEDFKKKQGKYMLLEMASVDDDEEDADGAPSHTPAAVAATTSSLSAASSASSAAAAAASSYPASITTILSEISNRDMMQRTLTSLNIDPKKMPLGKISAKMIGQARDVLKEIGDAINDGEDTVDLSSTFWTIVPYATKMTQTPPIIKTNQEVSDASDMLDTLSNMQVASRIIKEGSGSASLLASLGVEMTDIDKTSELYEGLRQYVTSTCCPTHGYKLKLEEAVCLSKDLSQTDEQVFSELTNHRLLVHGSRTANFMGILKEGLRIPKYDQVSNGSTLGLGCYFADCVTKSFNYTYSQDVGYVVLCEVALGSMHQVKACDPSRLNTSDYDSRMAQGTHCPSSWLRDEEIGDTHVYVPNGPVIKAPDVGYSTFLYNEYVIYQPAYKFRYMLRLRRIKV